MKKRITKRMIIRISLIIIILVVIYFCFFDTIGLVTVSKNESFISFSPGESFIAAVTDKGNVYVKGDLTTEINFGSDKIRQYNHMLIADYIQIFGKGNASSVEIGPYGGAIVTEQSEVFIFINGSEKYKTPVFLCKGYKMANLVENKVYLLSNEGVFGYVTIEDPDNFIKLGDNIVDFQIEYYNNVLPCDVCFALTADERLYISKTGEALSDNVQHLDGIIGFSAVVITADLPSDSSWTNHIVLGLLDMNHDVLWLHDDLNKNNGISKLADINKYSVVGNNIDKICVYPYGIAMLNHTGDVSLYGTDFHATNNVNTFSGEAVFHDVKDIFGGELLVLIYNNKEIEYYGHSYYFEDVKKDIGQ